MILLIGTKNCPKCEILKKTLDNKNINYTYKTIDEFDNNEQKIYLNMAKEKRITSFPLIIKDEKIITIQEV